MKWAFVAAVIFGDLLIIEKKRIGFLLWIICDGFFCISSCIDCMYPESVVFGIYAVLGLLGYRKWKQIT